VPAFGAKAHIASELFAFAKSSKWLLLVATRINPVDVDPHRLILGRERYRVDNAERAIRLPRNNYVVEDETLRRGLFRKFRGEPLFYLRAIIVGQWAREGHMEAEIVKDVWVTPTIEVGLLPPPTAYVFASGPDGSDVPIGDKRGIPSVPVRSVITGSSGVPVFAHY